MATFDQHSPEAQEIMIWHEEALNWFAERFEISFKEPPHDIARRFLNEITEFKPTKE